MAHRFQRWNIVEEDGRVTAVLLLLEDGRALSDPGTADCFAHTAAAAEAAWLRSGGPPPRGTWLQAADAAMASEPADAIGPRDRPRPRWIDADLIARDEVAWLQDLAGQSLSTTNSPDTSAPPGDQPVSQSALDAFLGGDDAPLSGQMTKDWALAEFAGLSTQPPEPDKDALGTVSEAPLSGTATRDWQISDFGAVAGGGTGKDDEEPPR